MSYVLYYIVSTILYQVLLSSQLLYRKDVSLRDVGVGSHFDLLSRVVYALIEGPLALQYNCRRCLLAQLRSTYVSVGFLQLECGIAILGFLVGQMQPQLGIRKRFIRSLSGVDRCSLSW